MKTLSRSLGLALFIGGSAMAQVSAPPAAPAAPEAAVEFGALRSAEQLEQLLAPIALYPDALIAIILPASTAATDIVLAARHLRDYPDDRSQIEHRAWDESVKSLTYYPEVLKWMDENLPWTKQVGEAFLQQPADVMQAIQRLRARARAAGTLADTPQQVVLAEPDVIRIVPAQPDVIYVPRYEPDLVFVHQPYVYTWPLLTFGIGVRAGSWLNYDCDWRRRVICVGDRHRPWRGHDWRRPVVPVAPGFTHSPFPAVRHWTPPRRPVTRPAHYSVSRPTPAIVRPTPIGSPTSRGFAPRATPPDRRIDSLVHSQPSPAASMPPASPPQAVGRQAGSQRRPTPNTPAQLYTSDRSIPVPAASPVVPPPSAAPRTATMGPRQVPAFNHSSPARPSTQPVMGPQPPPGFRSSPAAAQPRLDSRPTQGAHPRSAPVIQAPMPAPATAPAPAVSRTPAVEAPQQSSTRSAPASLRGGIDRSGRRGDDAQR